VRLIPWTLHSGSEQSLHYQQRETGKTENYTLFLGKANISSTSILQLTAVCFLDVYLYATDYGYIFLNINNSSFGYKFHNCDISTDGHIFIYIDNSTYSYCTVVGATLIIS
jgi:hypothetical protein